MMSNKVKKLEKTLATILIINGLMASSVASAEIKQWDCADGDWNNATCWSGGTAPLTTDVLHVVKDSAQDITINYINPGPAIDYDEVIIGNNGSGSVTVIQTGDILSTREEHIGQQGNGSYVHSAGTHNVSEALIMGGNTGGNGSYSLSGTGSLNTQHTAVGGVVTGYFTQANGTHTTTELFIGTEATGSGTYDMTGGTLNVTAMEQVGRWGSGTFNQSGGVHNTHEMYIARKSGTGIYNMMGGTLNSTDSVRIGYIPGSNAELHQTGGDIIATNNIIISGNGGDTRYILEGGTVTATAIINNDQFSILGPNAGIAADIENNGLLEMSDGSLIGLTGGLLLGEDSIVSIELGSLFSSSLDDWFNASGDIFLDGTLEITLADGFSVADGDTWNIFKGNSVTGGFDNIIFTGFNADTFYDADFVGIKVSAVPVPAAVWLFGSGLIGLIGVAKRKKNI